MSLCRLEEEIARMKKNQERRLHRKNAKIVKEGGTPMQLNRPVKPDTTVSTPLAKQIAANTAPLTGSDTFSDAVGTVGRWAT